MLSTSVRNIIDEQRDNWGSTAPARDVGRHLAGETNDSKGGLKQHLSEGLASGHSATEIKANLVEQKVGEEGDLHEKAASKQP